MNKMTKISVLTALLLSGMLLPGCSKEDPAEPGQTFTTWPEYNPTIYYDFNDDYPDFVMPTRNLPYMPTAVAWTMQDGWWSFFAGRTANALVTQAAVAPLLTRLNEEFGYIRDVMGWPPYSFTVRDWEPITQATLTKAAGRVQLPLPG
jgi:hypothetical protein